LQGWHSPFRRSSVLNDSAVSVAFVFQCAWALPTRSRSAASRLARAAGAYLAFLMFRIAIAPVAPLMTAISRTAPVRFFFHIRSAK
jgi:hypothetical protein